MSGKIRYGTARFETDRWPTLPRLKTRSWARCCNRNRQQTDNPELKPIINRQHPDNIPTQILISNYDKLTLLVSCTKPVIFLLCNNLFIYQVLCTLIYRRRSLYSFLLNQHLIRKWLGANQTTVHYLNECQARFLTHVCVNRLQWVHRWWW